MFLNNCKCVCVLKTKDELENELDLMNMCNNHPNIVQAYDALIITDEKNRKRFCIIMEYCEYEFTIKAVRDFATNELKENLVKII